MNDLETIYVPTGRDWIGRRNRSGGVLWEARRRTVDPAAVYRLDSPLSWLADALARLKPGRAGTCPRRSARGGAGACATMGRMRLRIFTEPQQGASYATLRRVATATEDLGFDAFFRSDHYLKMGGVSGEPGPSDAWATLAALAVETTRIRLGTLVTAATFRLPGPLAITVAQVDEMSGGRVELGIGAGWFDAEHTAYGVPFPPLKERFDRFEEQLAIITGLWSTPAGETFSYDGALLPGHRLARAAQAGPAPEAARDHRRRRPAPHARARREVRRRVQRRVPAARGRGRASGGCGRRAPRRAATRPRSPSPPPRWSAAARTRPSSPAAPRRSAATWPSCARTASPGSPAEIVDKIGAFAEAGAHTFYLQILDLDDLDHLELLASEVLPQV